MINVYILDFGNRIKIGRTKNLDKRIKTIENTSGEKIKQLFFAETDNDKENMLHYCLHKYRTIGEYFTCSFDIAKSAFQNILNGEIKLPLNIKKRKKESSITRSCYDLSKTELKMIIFLILWSRINSDDNDYEFPKFKFDMGELYSMIMIGEANSKRRKIIKDTILELSESKWFDSENNRRNLWWLEKPYVDWKNSIIKIQLAKNMKPYLLKLKEKYNL